MHGFSAFLATSAAFASLAQAASYPHYGGNPASLLSKVLDSVLNDDNLDELASVVSERFNAVSPTEIFSPTDSTVTVTEYLACSASVPYQNMTSSIVDAIYTTSEAASTEEVTSTVSPVSVSEAPETETEAITISSTTDSDTESPTSSEPETTSSTPSGQTYTGRGTFYSVGADACGTSSSDSDYVVAIAESLYTSYDLSSEWISGYCGREIVASYGGKSVTVKVVDACASCDTYDLDFSPTAFSALADQDVGVIQVEWQWA